MVSTALRLYGHIMWTDYGEYRYCTVTSCGQCGEYRYCMVTSCGQTMVSTDTVWSHHVDSVVSTDTVQSQPFTNTHRFLAGLFTFMNRWPIVNPLRASGLV